MEILIVTMLTISGICIVTYSQIFRSKNQNNMTHEIEKQATIIKYTGFLVCIVAVVLAVYFKI